MTRTARLVTWALGRRRPPDPQVSLEARIARAVERAEAEVRAQDQARAA